jgi:hypothetical protein
MSPHDIVLTSGIDQIEGLEAVLYVIKLLLQEHLPTSIAEVKAEWDTITGEALPLDPPDDTAYRLLNSESALPDEVDQFPFVLIMGLTSRPDDEAMEQEEGDVYWHDVVIRTWVKGDVPSDLTKQNYRYGEAIMRALHLFKSGAYDSTGTQVVSWIIKGLSASYSSTTEQSPFFMVSDISFSCGVLRSWAI